jgi:hypothetical protein
MPKEYLDCVARLTGEGKSKDDAQRICAIAFYKRHGMTPQEAEGKGMMSKWIQIGKACAIEGKIPITVQDLDTMVRDYDPRLCEAPVVLGHPDTDSPAMGWVEKLRRVGETLWGKIKQVSPELQKMVREGAFKHISMAVYPSLKETGRIYLRHVGFLGGAPPAMKGMAAARFADGKFETFDDMALPISEALDRAESVMRVLDGAYMLIDRIHGILDDANITDPKQAILDQVDSLRSLVEAETFTEQKRGGTLMNFWEKLKALFVEAGVKVPGEEAAGGTTFTEGQVKEREEAAAKKAKADTEVAAAKTARVGVVHAEVTAFVEAGIKAGTFLPAWKEAGIPGVIEQAMLSEAEIAFGDGKPARKAGEILMDLFKGMPKIVPLGEHAAGQGTDPDAALKAEFAAGAKVHELMGVTFEMFKKQRAAKT